MAYSGFSRPDSGFDFIALRRRKGVTEIVYDDGVARRLVWRVQGAANEGSLTEALAHARREVRVLPALYAELRKRSIAIEAIAG
ncbi:hypothetical protein C8J27_106233 [Rhodobacter aestuarii]|uniref:Uncharacterized protein n=1 Tax=Rhodobacter aestuarii TaxID=453582 RepID=A0A1N7MB09_9RHOB|nr:MULTISPECIES: hypothetical protein [Rhodobacter]PTV94964.1 hypothetical protein C8J27_106233 [Rhodobacter aestuarii]SIS83243.1 hypothetical protein SAMN05421580_105233 [Rhodobacter aestuarii]SOB97785.1 hypothetical protein SAMN05877809_10236 [Rhodobacter sp. JA431]